MIIYFGTFNKRENSTKVPNTSTLIPLECRLKSPCSVDSPYIEISYEAAYTFNYAYIPKWHRYYFVSSITSIDSRTWGIALTDDVLASHRADILNYSCMIDRSASDFDEMIEDGHISQTYEDPNITRADIPLTWLNHDGCFILKTAGGGTGSSVGVNAYVTTANDVKNLLDWAFLESSWGDWLTNFVGKILFNPFKYIVSLIWIPISYSAFGGDSVPIKMGNFTSTATGKKLTTETLQFTTTATVPDSLYDDFRKYSGRWNKLMVKLPAVGMINLDPMEMGDTFDITYLIDTVSWGCTVYIKSGLGTSPTLVYTSGSIGVPIQISDSNYDAASLVSSMVVAYSSSNPVSVTDAATNITQPVASVSGVAGNKSDLALIRKGEIIRVEYNSKEIPLTTEGRPLHEVRTLGDLSGFCRCLNAAIPLAALDSERAAINSYLNSGFYIE